MSFRFLIIYAQKCICNSLLNPEAVNKIDKVILRQPLYLSVVQNHKVQVEKFISPSSSGWLQTVNCHTDIRKRRYERYVLGRLILMKGVTLGWLFYIQQ